MIADYHIHTRASPDAEGTIADCVKVAEKRSICEIGFSEHALLRPLRQRPDNFVPKMPDYLGCFLRVKEKSDISVKLGIEIDFFPQEVEKIRSFIEKYPFDYVIGSIHVIGDWIFDDSAEKGEFAKRNVLQVYQEYFGLVRSAAESGLFDVLGHPDIIKIFGNVPNVDFSPILEETAEALADANVCAEINTKGLRKPCREIYPSEQFLAILYRSGVPITFGSDAHTPEDIARNFKEAALLARKVGYTQTCTFEHRKRAFVAI